MKCLFHKSDYDGICSAAIVKHKYPDCVLHGMQYGDDTPWSNIIIGETVFMVDFSLPAEDMKTLNKRTHLVLIDHHQSAIEDNKGLHIEGLQRVGTAACALTWEYLFETPVPRAVKLLSDYDTWVFNDQDVLPFQYGLRLRETAPEDKIWTQLLSGNSDIVIDGIIEEGKLVLKYDKATKAYYAQAAAFELEWEGLRCVAINKLFGGSDLFESVWNPGTHDVMMSFGWLQGLWKVGLRSESTDVARLAKKYGGGGHAHAAGFSCKELPFLLQ